MKILVAGTPAVAIPTLHALAGHPDHIVMGVLTREDAPQGRKRRLTPSPLASAAAELGLPIIKANKVTPDIIKQIESLGADIGVVVAYGALLSNAALTALPRGWINLHFSALPRWRGAAPVQWGIRTGEPPAVTVFQLVKALDAGPIWEQTVFPALNNLTSGQLLDELATQGSTTVLKALAAIDRGETPLAQPEDSPTPYAAKLTASDGLINWGSTRDGVWRQFAATTPEPGAFGWVDGQRCKIIALATPSESVIAPVPGPAPGNDHTPGMVSIVNKHAIVQTGDGPIELVTVQPAGKRPMPATDWLRGHGGHARFSNANETNGAAS